MDYDFYNAEWQHLIRQVIPNKHTWFLDKTTNKIDICFTHKFLSNKRVLYLGIPSCFEPESNQQFKDYLNYKSDLKALGIDKIIYGSDDSPYVMDAWLASFEPHNCIGYMCDGLGQLSSDFNVYVDRSHLGLKQRVWRHFMILDDCRIEYFDAEDGMTHFGADQNPYDKCKPHNVVEVIKKLNEGFNSQNL